jgi:hypothetical protein
MRRNIEKATARFCCNIGAVEMQITLEKMKCKERDLDRKTVEGFTRLAYLGTVCAASGKKKGREILVGDILSELRFSDAPDAVIAMVAILEQYHKNDLCHGTRKQLQLLHDHPDVEGYDAAIALLKSRKLYVDHGFVYGTDWLVDPLPPDTEEELRRLVTELGGCFQKVFE